MSDSQAPQTIRRIAFAFTVDHFPGGLIIAHHYLQSKLARAGYAINVTLSSLHDLPADTDIVLIPPELAEAARQVAPQAYHVTLDSYARHPFYELLIERLKQGHEWTAAKRVEPLPNQPEIVHYRGYERVD